MSDDKSHTDDVALKCPSCGGPNGVNDIVRFVAMLTRAEQYDIAFKVAEHIGYSLVPTPAQAASHPSAEAMKAAVELEIHAALGRVQTVEIGRMIQKAIDAAQPPAAPVETRGSGVEMINNLTPAELANWQDDGNCNAGRARSSAATEQATGRYEFPYNRTFQAIAAATSVYAEGVGVNVSVKAFQEAFNSFPDAHPLNEPQASSAGGREEYPEPTPAMLDNNPLFDAIWGAIKRWDISRHNDGIYSGPTGNDVRHIYDAIKRIPTEPQEVRK